MSSWKLRVAGQSTGRGLTRVLAVLVALSAVIGLGPGLRGAAPGWQTTAFRVVRVPGSECTTDATAMLNRILARSSRGEEILLHRGSCYRVRGTVLLAHHRSIWINGNGATIRQRAYPGGNVVDPILELETDRSILVTKLYLRGPAGWGNAETEGDYGVLLRGDNGATFRHLHVTDVKGDWLALYSGPHGGLDRKISIVRSTFLNAGYHGVTVESVDGVTLNHDSFIGVGCDGVDLEYDIYPTVFVDGQPTQGAEDNVTIENSTWRRVHELWVVSYQGQQVQENNLRLIHNTLVGVGLTIGIIGNSQVPNSGLLVEDNVSTTPATGVWGGSIASTTASAPIWLTNVDDVRIVNNNIALFDGLPGYFPDHPYMPAIQIYGDARVTVTGNSFDGALTPLSTDSPYYPSGTAWAGRPSSDVIVCSDRYSVNDTRSTAAC